MKIIFREWLQDKRASALMVGHVLLAFVYIGLNAYIVTLISTTVSDLANWESHFWKLMGFCAFQCVLGPLKNMMRRWAIKFCFRSMMNRYVDCVIDADAEMFTKHSTSFVIRQASYPFKILDAGKSITHMVENCWSIIATLFTLWVVGGNILFIVGVVYGIGAIIFRKLFSVFEDIDKQCDDLYKERDQEIEDIVNGFLEVRSFHTQETHRASLHKRNQKIFLLGNKRSSINGFTDVAFETVDTLGLGAVIWYAVKGLANGVITQAQGMSLVMLVFRIIDPLAQVLDFLDVISSLKAGAPKYDQIMSYENRLLPSGGIRMDSFEDTIELRNVNFSYDNSSATLRNVSMTIPKGKKVGICGASGAGKSTLFKLLNRFYDESSGEILIDGINLHNISMQSFRRHVGSVQQENTVFPGTLYSNLKYGNPYATDAEVIEACRKANIYDFIMGLPERFETVVGPRGLTLSGGQRQRIALARLFLSNPDIVLLDEATSALDNESETFVQEAIDGLSGKTIVTIAHRLSTIRNSDIIYVMGKGGILEYGTHEELMEKHGAYYAMQK